MRSERPRNPTLPALTLNVTIEIPSPPGRQENTPDSLCFVLCIATLPFQGDRGNVSELCLPPKQDSISACALVSSLPSRNNTIFEEDFGLGVKAGIASGRGIEPDFDRLVVLLDGFLAHRFA